ncbi:helix-turn-helix domain-containing protein [Streptomyces halstedii]|uniref:helix-turn-helix domain-containing protein n=1 Tax=Streptomyces halstedii TaxID=1944 RepID=UPI00380F4348
MKKHRSTYLQLPVDEIAERYLAGEPVSRIAKSLGVSHPTIVGRLRDGGHYVKRRSSVTAAQGAAAVALYVSGLSGKAVAKQLGVSRSTIRKVVTAAGVAKHPTPEEKCATDLHDGPYREIAARYEAGESVYSLAREYGISRSTLQRRMAALGGVRPEVRR